MVEGRPYNNEKTMQWMIMSSKGIEMMLLPTFQSIAFRKAKDALIASIELWLVCEVEVSEIEECSG